MNIRSDLEQLLTLLHAQLEELTPVERGYLMLTHGLHDAATTTALQQGAAQCHDYNLALRDAIASLKRLLELGFPTEPKLVASRKIINQILVNIKEVNAAKSHLAANMQAIAGKLVIEE